MPGSFPSLPGLARVRDMLEDGQQSCTMQSTPDFSGSEASTIVGSCAGTTHGQQHWPPAGTFAEN
jgi:hypothetical protein